MSLLHMQIKTAGRTVIDVRISGPANVLLMDPLNYFSYTQGGEFEYYGGHFREAGRCRVKAPSRGTWHLVVDSGPTPVTASYRMVPSTGGSGKARHRPSSG